MKKRIESRLADLENVNGPQLVVSVFQDYDDLNLWHEGAFPNSGVAYTWDQIEAKFPEYKIIRVVYVKDWKHPAD